MSNDKKVTFYQYDEPALEAREYTIFIEQEIYSQQKEENSERKDGRIPSTTFTKEADFAVYTERFSLNPQDIEAVFPPANSLGDYGNCFPHVLIRRSTLPWERRACDEEKQVPWLTLLLFDQEEKPVVKTFSLTKLREEKNNNHNIKFPDLTPEPAQDKDDLVNVIDVQPSLLKQIIPATTKELALMAHVRHSDHEFAVIFGNRLPIKAGSSTVHLVSLEKLYNSSGFIYKDTENENEEKDKDDEKRYNKIRLVSLKSWSFTSFSRKRTFEDILKNLDRRNLRLSDLPNEADTKAQNYVKQGYVPLRHHLRGGQKTISWYCSPLSPGHDPDQYKNLPVATADELVRYNPENGLFEVTYAAAWQLGRLLTLENKAVAIDLFQWKRSQTQALEAEKQNILHLPIKEQTNYVEGMPINIQEWFRDLSLLKYIPFKYLVPDQKMLPVESIRFFQVDQLWVDCLLDGAFSIGRITKSDQNNDNNTHILGEYKKETLDYLSGCLLRSEVVSGYPHLMVEAYKSVPKKENGEISEKFSLNSAEEIDLVRMERLSKNVLLCLFAGKIATLDIYRPPEKLPFGLSREEEKFYKTMRDNGPTIASDNLWLQKDKRVVNMQGLAEAMKGNNNAINSSLFAFHMIEGVQKVRFSRGLSNRPLAKVAIAN